MDQNSMAGNGLQQAIARTLAAARRAIDEHGITEAAMLRIQQALGSLAKTPGLKEHSALREMHGTDAASTVLASEGSEGLTLIFARFPATAPTPIHDHGSWGVAYVVEGLDRYTQWERLDDGSDPEHAKLQVQYEKILTPGGSVYWLNPPHDIHSQQGHGEPAWELVLFGRDVMHIERHYFDREKGLVVTAMPQ